MRFCTLILLSLLINPPPVRAADSHDVLKCYQLLASVFLRAVDVDVDNLSLYPTKKKGYFVAKTKAASLPAMGSGRRKMKVLFKQIDGDHYPIALLDKNSSQGKTYIPLAPLALKKSSLSRAIREYFRKSDWTAYRDRGGAEFIGFQNLRSKPMEHSESLMLPVFPSVFEPNNIYATHLIRTTLNHRREGDEILVIGAGSGVDAVMLAKATGQLIDANDINPVAVANTHTSALFAGVSELVEAEEGDLLETVTKKYDIIVFDAPLATRGRQKSMNLYDPQAKLLNRLIKQAPLNLKPGGRLLVMSHPDIEPFVHPNLWKMIEVRTLHHFWEEDDVDQSDEPYAILEIRSRQAA